MEFSAEDIEKKLATLPDELRSLVLNKELGETLIKIGQDHHLSVGKTNEVAIETNSVITGFTDPNEFVPRLRAIGLDEDAAHAVAEDINKKIFVHIRESLKKLYAGEYEEGGKTAVLTEEDIRAAEKRDQEDKARASITPESILKDRFVKTNISRTVETDHSEEKPAPQQKAPPDPYREPIE